MVIKVKEFQTILGRMDDMINKFIAENRIPKNHIVDIKYTAIATGIMALLIYDDGKKTYSKTKK